MPSLYSFCIFNVIQLFSLVNIHFIFLNFILLYIIGVDEMTGKVIQCMPKNSFTQN